MVDRATTINGTQPYFNKWTVQLLTGSRAEWDLENGETIKHTLEFLANAMP